MRLRSTESLERSKDRDDELRFAQTRLQRKNGSDSVLLKIFETIFEQDIAQCEETASRSFPKIVNLSLVVTNQNGLVS